MTWQHDKPDCQHAFERLDTYVDRELTDEELEVVRGHLESCPPCQHFFQVHEGVKTLVHRKACTEKAPHHLVERILKSLK